MPDSSSKVVRRVLVIPDTFLPFHLQKDLRMPTRILTTHVGSLPRSAAVTAMIFAKERDEPVDPAAFAAVLDTAVDAAVARQVAAGIDLVSDGEMSKISYATYIKDRISGFAGDSPRSPPADLERFPAFLERQSKGGGTPTYRRPRCVGPIASVDLSTLVDDLAMPTRLHESDAVSGARVHCHPSILGPRCVAQRVERTCKVAAIDHELRAGAVARRV